MMRLMNAQGRAGGGGRRKPPKRAPTALRLPLMLMPPRREEWSMRRLALNEVPCCEIR